MTKGLGAKRMSYAVNIMKLKKKKQQARFNEISITDNGVIR